MAAVQSVDPVKLGQSLATISQAVQFLKDSGKTPRILVKIARNLGDSLHGQPIIRHFRNLHPNACIVFLCEQRYHGVHEYNGDIDKLFLLPNDLNPQTRMALWDPIKSNKDIDIAIIPSINPFQYGHPENKWLDPHPNITTQYLHNAGIKEPLGGRPVVVNVDYNDRQWADNFLKKNNAGPLLVGMEYNSYSAPLAWNAAAYSQFVQMVKAKGWHCISFAGANEPLMPGTLDARGATWRQTVALISKVKYMLGCSSGNTMLALASRPQPIIIELNPPDDCRADQTGYIIPGNYACAVMRPTPAQVAALIEVKPAVGP